MIEIQSMYNQIFFSKIFEEGFFCANILKELFDNFQETEKEIFKNKENNPISIRNYQSINSLFNDLSTSELEYIQKNIKDKQQSEHIISKQFDKYYGRESLIWESIHETILLNFPTEPKRNNLKWWSSLVYDLSKVIQRFHDEDYRKKDFFYTSVLKEYMNNLRISYDDAQPIKDYFNFMIIDFFSKNGKEFSKTNNNHFIEFINYFINNCEKNKKQWYQIYLRNLHTKYGDFPYELKNKILKERNSSKWKIELDNELYKKENIIYLYDKKRVHIHAIKSLEDFSSVLNVDTDKNSLFFRGQSDSNYLFHPSIIRSSNILKNENNIYEESLARNPEEYLNIYQTHLDILKKMQHYNVPTRLMDITDNLLVGVFFAIESNDEKDGELIVLQEKKDDLKYTRSDSVTILCSLPPFSQKEKNEIFNLASSTKSPQQLNGNPIIKRLLHEVTSEKAFEPEIKSETFYKDRFVIPKRDNRRIIQQSGSFIICTLNINAHSSINNSRLRDSKDKNLNNIFVIPSQVKGDLKASLNMFGINHSTIYPEIEKVADFLKEKYS